MISVSIGGPGRGKIKIGDGSKIRLIIGDGSKRLASHDIWSCWVTVTGNGGGSKRLIIGIETKKLSGGSNLKKGKEHPDGHAKNQPLFGFWNQKKLIPPQP